MELPKNIEDYSKLSIFCDSQSGNVTFLENYIPTAAVEKYADRVLKGLWKQYFPYNCITEIIKQPFGEDKINSIVNFQPNAYGNLIKEAAREILNQEAAQEYLYQRAVDKYSNQPITLYNNLKPYNFSSVATDLCVIVLAYQALKTISHLRNRNIKQAQKHGINAIVTVIVLLILTNTLLRL